MHERSIFLLSPSIQVSSDVDKLRSSQKGFVESVLHRVFQAWSDLCYKLEQRWKSHD